jgi:hypothetical protein
MSLVVEKAYHLVTLEMVELNGYEYYSPFHLHVAN